MRAKYVVRIDGAKNGSEMITKYADGGMMKENYNYVYVRKMLLVHLGEGSSIMITELPKAISGINSPYNKFLNKEIVIEEIKPDSTQITKAFLRETGEEVPFVIDTYNSIVEKYADGGMMAKGGDTRGEFGTFLIEIFENGVLRKEKIVRGGYKNLVEEMAKEEAKSYKKPVVNVRKIMSDTTHVDGGMMADGGDTRGEFGTFLIEIFENGVLRKEKIVRGGYKNLVEEMAKEEAKSYKKPVVNVRKIMSDTTHVAFNLMDKNEYSVVGWMSEEDRDMGESEGLGMYDSLEEAKRKADVAFYRQGYAAVEVLRLSQQGDEDDEVVYFVEEGSEEFAKGGKIKEGDKVIYKGEERTIYSIYPNNMVSLCLQDEDGEEYEDVEEDYLISMDKIKKYALGGMFKSRYNTGRSWHLDHARHNKKEDYEVPMASRKGASKSAPAKSGAKRAKTGKYAKSSRAASSSSSSRGYNYIPNAKIKSITTTDDKVITSKKILDGAYVRKKNGGMM